ncbi:MAG: alpha/beta fold hydrolase [Burkholderiaceae bacterium]|nr:alpha/beta fold hydrolase [Burkholderiaceae bacterium]
MRVQANGLGIEVDDQGPPNGAPLLLIMGLGMQLLAWPQELVDDLVARGFRVIRFDNRDIGLSQGFDHLGVPRLWGAALRHLMHLPVQAPYSLADMADDAAGVLDALGLASAHVCGASMGGMIAQHLAARHAPRVRSLSLVMTTSGARHLPQPGWPVRQALLARPRSLDPAHITEHIVKLLALIGSPAWRDDPQRVRQRIAATVQRSWHPAGTARQLVAVVADGDRSPLLGRITAPTRVVHGSADPLVPPEGGRDLARKIRGAELEIIDGMGHDLPLALLPRLAEGIAAVAARAG